MLKEFLPKQLQNLSLLKNSSRNHFSEVDISKGNLLGGLYSKVVNEYDLLENSSRFLLALLPIPPLVFIIFLGYTYYLKGESAKLNASSQQLSADLNSRKEKSNEVIQVLTKQKLHKQLKQANLQKSIILNDVLNTKSDGVTLISLESTPKNISIDFKTREPLLAGTYINRLLRLNHFKDIFIESAVLNTRDNVFEVRINLIYEAVN